MMFSFLVVFTLARVHGTRLDDPASSNPNDEDPVLSQQDADAQEELDQNSPMVLARRGHFAFKAGAPPCVCKDEWSYQKYRGCRSTVYGCPKKACDSANTPWCLVKKTGCATEEAEAGWAFCGPHADGSGSIPPPNITDRVDPTLQLNPALAAAPTTPAAQPAAAAPGR
eukprot:TRINITY_DN6850_c0_g1_i1.p1 TRINITY_DN6850_c0_g1~~TRINITY_DN6850_c0_g1_i1.p1  ORF type:complete len:169 (+),score=27.98 TRINITY_DN6850_c0_g1_i1:84-590(+)